MTTFSIPDMTCGHCKATVEAAILKLDPSASVLVDLVTRRADVTSVELDEALLNALNAVGFPAKAV